MREALLAYKERGHRSLAGVLGALLARCLLLGVPAGCLTVSLVPVPSAAATVRRRGHDHVRALAAVAARLIRRRGVRVRVVPLLTVTRRAADSVGLSSDARWANLVGAFGCRSVRPPPGRLVIVDDVVTTGATLAEAARALASGGLRAQSAAVVAATQRRWPTWPP